MSVDLFVIDQRLICTRKEINLYKNRDYSVQDKRLICTRLEINLYKIRD